ncbi:unnamed protein product [Discula destructiva]
MSLKKPVRTLRLAKQSLTPRVKTLIAAVTLALVWIVGPHTAFRRQTDDVATGVESARNSVPFANSKTKGKDAARVPTTSDQLLNRDDAEKFCLHYHLEPYDPADPLGTRDLVGSKDQKGSKTHVQHVSVQRRIYDLLLITHTTSANMLELHLASMYPYVEYFVMLEAPSVDQRAPAESSNPLKRSGAPDDEPSFLDKIWQTQLSPYHAKIIRHTLSQHSEDFKAGLDHESTTRNALYTRVIPLLTKEQRVEPGDVLLVSDVEELVRPVTLKVLLNCYIPRRTTIRTRKYWYSFQYMKVTRPATKLSVEEAKDLPLHPFPVVGLKKNPAGNEWWPHPQATVYTGPDTVLPDELRKERDLDEYTFGDGGWTCYLCDNTITETLAKLNKSGIIWAEGPRWKAAGRVVDRVMTGVDLLERTNLSRIESNPDIPPYLQANKDRFHWMVDRDGPGAKFVDFEVSHLEEYRAKKVAIDAQPDFERTSPDLAFNLENTQDDESWQNPPADWRSESNVE